MTIHVTTSLSHQLADTAAQNARQIPAEAQEIMRNADAELAGSSLIDASLKYGDIAPDFALPNAIGQTIRLSGLSKRGPVILSFYRGGWCPFCNLELRALQQALPDFERYGARLVAISPELAEHADSTADQLGLSFEVLSDVGNQVARQFGLVFQVPESLRAVYAQFGIDLPARNGDDTFELPVPATYVVDEDRRIAYAFVNTDYKQRAEPTKVIHALRRLASK